MKTFRIALAVLLVGTVSAFAAAPSGATGSGSAVNPIVAACEHDGYQLTGHYTVAQLKAAYNSIPAPSRAYETCAQVIETKLNQIVQNDKVNPNGSGSGSGFPWLIVVIVVIVVLGGGGAFWSYRRSQAGGGSDPGPDA